MHRGYELSTRHLARYWSRSCGSNFTSFFSPMRYAESFLSETNFRIVFWETPKYSAAALEDSNRTRLGGAVLAGESDVDDVGEGEG